MKKFLCKIMCMLESFNNARAASVLARQGHQDLAKKLMMQQEKCEC